jgi:hypothetical protein
LQILKSWEFGIFGNSGKTGNYRMFYILVNIIFCKSWENWKLEYFGNLGKLEIVESSIFWEI